jgi:hypothetical protein
MIAHPGAPPAEQMKRAAREAARGSAVAVGAANSTTPPRNTQARALPAGAAKLLEKRYRGRVPTGSVFIAADRNVGRNWPWRIIVDDDPDRLDFSVCAGLSVIVGALDQSRLKAISRAVSRYLPRHIVTVNYGVPMISAVVS